MGARLAERPFDMWRYREVLPIGADTPIPPISVGGSPVSESAALADWLGVARAVITDDGRNPSASLKDRASAIGVALAAGIVFDAEIEEFQVEAA